MILIILFDFGLFSAKIYFFSFKKLHFLPSPRSLLFIFVFIFLGIYALLTFFWFPPLFISMFFFNDLKNIPWYILLVPLLFLFFLNCIQYCAFLFILYCLFAFFPPFRWLHIFASYFQFLSCKHIHADARTCTQIRVFSLPRLRVRPSPLQKDPPSVPTLLRVLARPTMQPEKKQKKMPQSQRGDRKVEAT